MILGNNLHSNIGPLVLANLGKLEVCQKALCSTACNFFKWLSTGYCQTVAEYVVAELMIVPVRCVESLLAGLK